MDIRGFKGFLVCVPLFLVIAPAKAQTDEEEDQLSEIMVTGTRVTAGGAQDIAFARSEISSGRIPHPDTFTDEGLLSQHDLTLPGADTCEQLFCVFGEAIRSDVTNKPDDRYFVGLGFSTNIKAESWQREPQNIVAVIDKSGSMHGKPLALVRRSLLALTKVLDKNDQLSIVLYGDRSHVYLEPTRMTRNKLATVREQIEAIESSGSTNMEEGLEVGYRLARESQAGFEGATRLILFTDERPNVGDTSANGFIGMAKAASELGVGLTTIGVGVQFDSSLAVKISSTRGGNLFFLPDKEAADTLFDDEFDYMVSELAHDLTFVLRPHADLRISGVYGLPGDLLSWSDDRAVTFTIPTVFLSSRGGGIFVSLAPADEQADLPPPTIPAGANVLAGAITYVPAKGSGAPESHLADVAPQRGKPSHAIRLASLLVDEYLSLRKATTEHYVHNNQEAAYRALHALNNRFSNVRDRKLEKALEDESDMVVQLLDKFAFLSGRASEVSSSNGSELWGAWRITFVEAGHHDEGFYDDIEVGHYLLFSPDNRVVYVEEDDYSDLDWDESEPYRVSESELLLPEYDTVFKYRVRRNQLTLRYRNRSEGADIRFLLVSAGPFPLDGFVAEDADYVEAY